MGPSWNDLHKLESLYAGGTTSVRLSDGSEVRYSPDLLQRIKWLRQKLKAESGSPQTMSNFTTFGRG